MLVQPKVIDANQVLENVYALSADPRAAQKELSTWLKAEMAAGRWDDLARALPSFITQGLDYTSAFALHRVLRQVSGKARVHDREVKIAVLGSFTTHQLVTLLDLYLHAGRVAALVYEADYGTFRQELLDPESELYRFRPDFIIFATSWRDLGHLPEPGDDRVEVQRKVEAELADWVFLWKTAHERLGCQVLQNNFDLPPWRTLGNHEARHPSGFSRYASLVNLAIQDAAPSFVTIHDIDHLAASWGRWEWGDERYYHHAKLPCSPEHLVDYAHSLASLILAHLGVVKKCLVLDLDNTLWGGVIGEDGINGIKLGDEYPGTSYREVQRALLDLRQRGILLALCSKNNLSDAMEVLERHPEMLLRPEHFAAIRIDWNDKSANLREIAAELNIGIDALAFVDDNPVERQQVRGAVPEVTVIELPEGDPLQFARAIRDAPVFERLTLSAEDAQRGEMYRVQQQRQKLESAAGSREDFYRSLEQEAEIGRVTAATLARVAQLTQKTNQFNLTTRRYTEQEIEQMSDSADWRVYSIRVRDRFSDNGLVGVAALRRHEHAWEIDTLLLSCRVIGRTVETAFLAYLIDETVAAGASVIEGWFLPTKKNAPASEFYSSHGFRLAEETGKGARWVLDLPQVAVRCPEWIRITPQGEVK
jgi:FkbH-like protein